MPDGTPTPEELDDAWWKAVSECDGLTLACMIERGFENPGRLNLMCRNAIGQVLMECAFSEGRTRDLVEVLLLGGCPLDESSSRAFPAMSLAASRQPLSIIRFLHERGAKVCDEVHGIYLLHEACANPDKEVALYLADLGARLDLIRPADQRSLLHAAIRHDHRAMAERVIQAKVHLDHRDRHGNTPAMVLAHNQDLSLLALVLAAGADASLKDRMGRSIQDLLADVPGAWDELMATTAQLAASRGVAQDS